jgi:hypothetical protein
MSFLAAIFSAILGEKASEVPFEVSRSSRSHSVDVAWMDKKPHCGAVK